MPLILISRNTSIFSNIFKGKRIGIYEHSSAGRDLYSEIFSKLGAEVVSIGRSDEFVPIDTEAVSKEDEEKALHWSSEYDLDMIFLPMVMAIVLWLLTKMAFGYGVIY